MEFERHSSGVAKGGLTTGIIGTSLGALALMGNGANALGNLFGMGRTTGDVVTAVPVPVPMGGCGFGGWGSGGWNSYNGGRNGDYGCSEDHHVNRYELGLQQKIAEKDSQIALRDANTYGDQKMLEMYKYIDGRFQEFERELGRQAVINQKTEDSFALVKQDVDCCCRRLEEKICDERRERRCADNTIITYTNATFYPIQKADLTTGTTSTPQATYNPLPQNNGGCCCGNN